MKFLETLGMIEEGDGSKDLAATYLKSVQTCFEAKKISSRIDANLRSSVAQKMSTSFHYCRFEKCQECNGPFKMMSETT